MSNVLKEYRTYKFSDSDPDLRIIKTVVKTRILVGYTIDIVILKVIY